MTESEREVAMVRCSAETQACDVRSYALAARYPHQIKALGEAGYVLMTEHAALVLPCQEHAKP